jgi:hypothetical protein
MCVGNVVGTTCVGEVVGTACVGVAMGTDWMGVAVLVTVAAGVGEATVVAVGTGVVVEGVAVEGGVVSRDCAPPVPAPAKRATLPHRSFTS